MKKIVLLVSLIACFVGASSSLAQIYRWKDKNGKVHYATTPPSLTVDLPIEVKRNNVWHPYTGQPDPSSASGDGTVTYTTSKPGKEMSQPVGLWTPHVNQTVVRYNKQNSVIIIDVTINGKITRPFAVDTGATYTVISPKILRALNLSPSGNAPTVTLQTANGRIDVPLANLESVQVGDLSTPNVMAAVHEFDDTASVYGLLGLNFLH